MSKSAIIIIIIVVVIAVVAAGGAYRFLRQDAPAAVPAELRRAEPPTSAPTTLTPNHGNFQKRYQPTMPPASGTGK